MRNLKLHETLQSFHENLTKNLVLEEINSFFPKVSEDKIKEEQFTYKHIYDIKIADREFDEDYHSQFFRIFNFSFSRVYALAAAKMIEDIDKKNKYDLAKIKIELSKINILAKLSLKTEIFVNSEKLTFCDEIGKSIKFIIFCNKNIIKYCNVCNDIYLKI